MGLAGLESDEKGSFDEDPELSRVIAAKMSKSKPGSNILIHDNPEVISEKLRKAYCPPGRVEGNPLLEYYRVLAFPGVKSVVLSRTSKYGGNMDLDSYSELEEMYKAEKIHPQDLKSNMTRILSDKLAPVRDYFASHHGVLEGMRKLEAGS